MTGERLQAWTPAFGIAAILCTFGGTGLAILASPAFAVDVNALSNLGVASHSAGTTTTVLLFNGGLILGGVFGIAFATGLALTVEHVVERIGAVLFGISMALMGGVGVFPQNGPYHFEVAAGFYMFFSVALLVYGPGQIIAEKTKEGLISVTLALGNLGVWVVWVSGGGIGQPGLAIPELIGAGIVAFWTLLQVRQRFPESGFSWVAQAV